MNILDFSDKDLITFGDIHGDFKGMTSLIHRTHQYQLFAEKSGWSEKKKKNIITMTDKAFVVCGDCGFGFNKIAYYETELKKLDSLLKELKSVVVFVRGNHDNPDYFNTDNFKLEFDNIFLASDYTVLKTKKDTTLCVGGAVSDDRSWRIREINRDRYGKFNSKRNIYWDGERVQPNPSLVLELKENGITVDSIITHTFPLGICENKDDLDLIDRSWVDSDKDLVNDIKENAKILVDMYETLENDGHKIKWWCCGHFHNGFASRIEKRDTKVYILNVLDTGLNYLTNNKNAMAYLSNGIGINLSGASASKKNEKVHQTTISLSHLMNGLVTSPWSLSTDRL